MKIDRLIGIVTILLQTEKSTVPALAQRFEVSRRTIERDIDALCRAGVPLVTVQGYGGGVFIEPRYKLDKTLLSGPELAALVAGAAGVGSVSPAPLARSLAEKLGGSGSDDLLIDLSSHYRESLTPKIELLRTAIAEHARVRFTYYYAKGVAEKCAEPYRIVFQWGDWYMFGWCPDAAGWRMYKLNRLTLLSVTAQTFEPRAIPPEALDFNALPRRHTAARPRRGQRMLPPRGGVRPGLLYPPAGRKPAAGDRLHQRRRRGSLAAGVRGKGRSAGTARAAGAHGVRDAGSVRGIWRAKKIKTQGHDMQMSCPCVYNQCKGGEPP